MKKQSFNGNWRYGIQGNGFMAAPDSYTPVTLPHDAMILRKRGEDAAGKNNTGYYPEGSYEYCKDFDVPAEWEKKSVTLEFEGVYMDAMIYINGMFAKKHSYGYTNFYVPITPYLRYGKRNQIKVVCRSYRDSRWYSGCGIYRPVKLMVGEPVHVAPDGLKMTTKELTCGAAVLEAGIELVNETRQRVTLLADTKICDREGAVVAENKAPVTLFPGKTQILRQRMRVENPNLWNVSTPYLYTCETKISVDGTLTDAAEDTFGIRILTLSAKDGLRINGEEVKLRGGCIHHDNGVIGSAAIDRAEERKVELLKAAGFNALRITHNPASRALLAACDRIGMLVMDEAFDMWVMNKNPYDYGLHFVDDWESDLESIVGKDYNHPSVILYSIGNEIPETGNPRGAEIGRAMAEKFRSMDSTRFVINSMNIMLSVMGSGEDVFGEAGLSADINENMTDLGTAMKQMITGKEVAPLVDESFAAVDVAGYNYGDARYRMDGEAYPNRVICGSETFPKDIASNWKLVTENSHVIGDFTWTGWDYLGECGIGKVDYSDGASSSYGDYPWFIAYCGDLDIIGTRRAQSYYREAVFGLTKTPAIVIQNPKRYGKMPALTPWSFNDYLPVWNYPGGEGKPVAMEVYADTEEVEVFVNGKSLGRKPAGKAAGFITKYDGIYEKGSVLAVAYDGGAEVGRRELCSADDTMGLQVSADRTEICGNDCDLAFVSLTHADSHGILDVENEIFVSVKVEGPAVLAGLGSPNPTGKEDFFASACTTFEGRALAVIRPTGAGTIRVTAGCGKYGEKTIEIISR